MWKINLSDGFYCSWLRPEDRLKPAVLFPSRPGEDHLVGIPLTNPMGWYLLPPNFSACTETVADLANASLENPFEHATAQMTPHRLDTYPKPLPWTSHQLQRPASRLFYTLLLSKSPYATRISTWTIFAALSGGNDGHANGSNGSFSAR